MNRTAGKYVWLDIIYLYENFKCMANVLQEAEYFLGEILNFG